MKLEADLDRELRDATSLEAAAAVLSELLSDGYSVWTDGSLYRIKQLVARVAGLQIHVYAREHAPPHFHVKSADVDATFTVTDCAFLGGNIDSREQRLVRWWYDRSRPLLVAVWNATRPADCPVGPLHE